jgi:hypothetical protein
MVSKKAEKFESYPVWMIFVYYLVSFTVYLAGLYLLYLIWPAFSALLLIYIVYLEILVLREGCVRCYYYGKRCVCGKGKLAKLLMKKDTTKKFNCREMSMKDFVPSMIPTIIALIAGGYLIYQGLPNFNFLILGIAVWPLVATFFGNPIVYGKIACPHCKQGELGCPACEFFFKKDKKAKINNKK